MSLAQVWEENSSLQEAVLAVYGEGLSRNIPRTELIEEILSLAGDDWKEAKAFIPFLEYKDNDLRYGCQTDDYGTVVDPISLEEIPLQRLVSFQEDGKKWCFDIATLFEYVERDKAVNPFTRQELPPEIQILLQKYKEREREIVVRVEIENEDDLEVKFPRGFPMAELVVAVFRAWNDFRSGKSAPKLLANFLLFKNKNNILSLITYFEEAITDPFTVSILPSGEVDHLSVAAYYRDLYTALEQRASLETYADFAYAAITRELKQVSFLQSAQFLSNGEMYLKVLAPEDENPFAFFKQEDEYFLPLNVVTNSARWEATNLTDSFLSLYFAPQMKSKPWEKQARTLRRYLTNTLNYLFRDHAKKKDWEQTKAAITAMSEEYIFDYDIDDMQLLLDNFSSLEVYALLEDLPSKPEWGIAYRDLPENFLKSPYFPALLTEDLLERQVIEELINGHPVTATDGVEQAKAVALLDHPVFYEQLKVTLDPNALYDALGEESKIKEVFTDKEKVAFSFRTGERSNLPPEFIRKEFEKLLETGTDKFDLYIFAELLGSVGKPYLSVLKVEEYLNQSLPQENIFDGMMVSLAEFIFLGAEDNLPTEEYKALFCRVLQDWRLTSPRIDHLLALILDSDFANREDLMQYLYQCIGLEKAINTYQKYTSFPPLITKEGVLQLVDSNFDLIRSILEKGLLK